MGVVVFRCLLTVAIQEPEVNHQNERDTMSRSLQSNVTFVSNQPKDQGQITIKRM